MERDYVPGFRDHMIFSMTGSPTTNERFCWSPGRALLRLEYDAREHRPRAPRPPHGRSSTSTSAARRPGYAGFAGTIWTGCRLYEASQRRTRSVS